MKLGAKGSFISSSVSFTYDLCTFQSSGCRSLARHSEDGQHPGITVLGPQSQSSQLPARWQHLSITSTILSSRGFREVFSFSSFFSAMELSPADFWQGPGTGSGDQA